MSDLEQKIDALAAEVRELRKLLIDRPIHPVRLEQQPDVLTAVAMGGLSGFDAWNKRNRGPRRSGAKKTKTKE